MPLLWELVRARDGDLHNWRLHRARMKDRRIGLSAEKLCMVDLLPQGCECGAGVLR